jgi:hypothetical protein
MVTARSRRVTQKRAPTQAALVRTTPTDPLTQVRADLEKHFPKVLVTRLLDAYVELKQRFLLGHHEPSELNAGKFAEAVVRMLQQATSGTHTALGKSLPRMDKLLPSFLNFPVNDSYRVHIPRVLNAIYDVRNKRGVGHLKGDVDPNLQDSTLLVSSADWILAELFRICFTTSHEEAKRIVDGLVQRPLPLVHEVNGVRRVLLPSLSQRDHVLALLASAEKGAMTFAELVASCEPKNTTDFRNRVLRTLHTERLIELRGEACTILPPGNQHVEREYAGWQTKLEGH